MNALTAKTLGKLMPALLLFIAGLTVGGLFLGPRNTQARPELSSNRIAQLEEKLASVSEAMAEVRRANDQLRAQNENLLKTPEGLWRQATAAYALFEADQDVGKLREASKRLRELKRDFPEFGGIAHATALSTKVEAHLSIAKAFDSRDHRKAKKLIEASAKVIGKDVAQDWLAAVKLMARQPMDTSLETMCELAEGNAVAFKKQYEQRWVRLDVTVEETSESYLGKRYVVTPKSDHLFCTQLSFKKKGMEDIMAGLRPGDSLNVECKAQHITGELVNFLLMNCRLL